MEVAGPLGTPLGLAQRKRASPRCSCVAGEFAWYVLPWNLLAFVWCLVSVSVWRHALRRDSEKGEALGVGVSQPLRQEGLSPTLRALEPRSPVCRRQRPHLPQEETGRQLSEAPRGREGKPGTRRVPGRAGGSS